MLKLINAKEMMAVKCIYPCDFQWLVETVYNLGLFCFNAGRKTEGHNLFGLIEQVILFLSPNPPIINNLLVVYLL